MRALHTFVAGITVAAVILVPGVSAAIFRRAIHEERVRIDPLVEQLLRHVSRHLGEQQDELVSEASDAVPEPTAADLGKVADRVDRVIASGEPEQAKALLRLLIAELCVNVRADIQPTYRVVTPGACATSGKVETVGIEPTSAIACEWLLRA